jgi:hypothetical protein
MPVAAVLHDDDDEDLLAGWVSQPKAVMRSRRRVEPRPGLLRFAFYGPDRWRAARLRLGTSTCL